MTSLKCILRHFEAAHRLPHVPPDHKCYRLHGHTYRLAVVVESADVEAARASVDALVRELDHTYLNDLKGLQNATSENIARWAWRHLIADISLVELRIDENDDSVCIYRGDD